MNLVTPDSGLIFWMCLIFAIVFFILAKFGFPVITSMVEKRQEKIEGALKAAEKSLTEYEEKLGLMKKFENSRNAAAEIEQEIDRIKDEYGDDKMLSARLDKIKGIIEKADF